MKNGRGNSDWAGDCGRCRWGLTGGILGFGVGGLLKNATAGFVAGAAGADPGVGTLYAIAAAGLAYSFPSVRADLAKLQEYLDRKDQINTGALRQEQGTKAFEGQLSARNRGGPIRNFADGIGALPDQLLYHIRQGVRVRAEINFMNAVGELQSQVPIGQSRIAIIGINPVTGNVPFAMFDTGPSITNYGTLSIKIQIQGARPSVPLPQLDPLLERLEKQWLGQQG